MKISAREGIIRAIGTPRTNTDQVLRETTETRAAYINKAAQPQVILLGVSSDMGSVQYRSMSYSHMP